MGLGFEVSLLLLCKNTIDYVHAMLTTSLLALHFSVANKATIAIKNGGELFFTCTPSRNSSLANNRSTVYYWVLLPWAGFSLHQIDMHVNLVSLTLHEALLTTMCTLPSFVHLALLSRCLILVSIGNVAAHEIKASHSIFMFHYISNPFLFWWDHQYLWPNL